MPSKRTDLADEARELFEEQAGKTTQLQGVRARQYGRRGCAVTAVEILNAAGSAALGKPAGRYRTIDLAPGEGAETFAENARCLAEELRRLLPRRQGDAPVLVAGLGNRAVTPDAVGPWAAEQILVTRHLRRTLGAPFSAFAPVCALEPGVLGTTGMESAEIVQGVARRVQPACVIVIDALVSRRMQRLCATVQLSDTGLIPGSGIGNHRAALNEETLHVPVLAVGVPTVIEGATLAADLLEQAGAAAEESALPPVSLLVAPKDIDRRARRLARLTACGINLALQRELDVEDALALTGGC